MSDKINSREKGKRGERAWRDELRKMGFTSAIRGVQHQGGKDSPDVVCDELPGVHCEVKFGVKGMDIGTGLLEKALDQAQADAADAYYVAWKPSRKPWRITYACPLSGLFVTVAGRWAMKQALLSMAKMEVRHG